jgi:hypothetical protein
MATITKRGARLIQRLDGSLSGEGSRFSLWARMAVQVIHPIEMRKSKSYRLPL